MTTSRRHLATAAFVASGVSVLAVSSVAPARAEGADAAAVAQAVAALTKAMLAADKARLEALTADQLSYGHSSGKVEDKATFVGVVASKKTVYKSIELSRQTVVVAGNDASCAMPGRAKAAPATANGTCRKSASCRSGRSSPRAGGCWRARLSRSRARESRFVSPSRWTRN
jgi:hypothetical protein